MSKKIKEVFLSSFEGSVTQKFRAAAEYLNDHPYTRLIIESGRYVVGDETSKAFLEGVFAGKIKEPVRLQKYSTLLDLKNTNDIEIVGENAEIVTDGYMQVIGVTDCEDVSVKGLAFDNVRRPYTHLFFDTVEEIEPEIYKMHFKADGEITETTPMIRATVYEKKTGCFHNYKIKELTFEGKEGTFCAGLDYVPQIGDCLLCIHVFSYKPTVFAYNSKNISVSDCTVYSQPGYAVGGQSTENITIDGLKVVPFGEGCYSTSVDATHFVACTGDIIVKNSEFVGCGDDAINTHNYFYEVFACEKNKALIGLTHITHFDLPVAPVVGNVMQFLSKEDFSPVYMGIVRNFSEQADGKYLVEFDEELPEACVSNIVADTTAQPCVTFENNVVESTFARGVLIKTSGSVVNNTFKNIRISGIKVSSESLHWMESFPPCDVRIKNNTIINCGYGEREDIPDSWAGIIVSADSKSGKYQPLENIVITDNVVDCKKAECDIIVKDVRLGYVSRNTVDRVVKYENCSEISDKPYAVIRKRNGNRKILIDGRAIDPLAFRSFRPTPGNVSEFKRIGVRLNQIQCADLTSGVRVKYNLWGNAWVGPFSYDFSGLDRQADMFLQNSPDSYLNIFIQLDTQPWWLSRNAECPESFQNFGQACFYDGWKNDASIFMLALVYHMEEKYGDKIWAYSISAGNSTEWFANDLGKPCAIKKKAYMEFCGKDIPELPVPPKNPENFRDDGDEEYDYLKWSCENTADTINHFANVLAKGINHRKLIGTFYGYIDIHDSYLQNLWQTNAYEKVWNNPAIDMFYSPACYGWNRRLGGASSFQNCVDSLELNGKLYLHEIDQRTSFSNYPLESGMILNDYLPFYDTIQVLRREFNNVLEKRSALWWFDFFGGYYDSPEYEAELKRQVEIYKEICSRPYDKKAEVAVFVDPMSYLRLREHANSTIDLVQNVRNALHLSGVPFETFNLADIVKLNAEKYKLFVFLTPFDIPENIRKYIKTELKEKSKLFTYGAGMARNGLSVKNIEDLCGIPVEQVHDGVKHVASFEGVNFSFSDKSNDVFRCKGGTPLAYFEDGGVAVAENGCNTYCGLGNIPSVLLQYIVKKSGAHIYAKVGTAVTATTAFIGTYSMDVKREIDVGYDGVFEDVYTNKTYATEKGILKFDAKEGQTFLFRKK